MSSLHGAMAEGWLYFSVVYFDLEYTFLLYELKLSSSGV
jgi:hypothetical protein